MTTDMERWKALCAEFETARNEEMRLLSLPHQAGGGLDLEALQGFDAAQDRTEAVMRRMTAFVAETLG